MQNIWNKTISKLQHFLQLGTSLNFSVNIRYFSENCAKILHISIQFHNAPHRDMPINIGLMSTFCSGVEC